MQLYSFEVERHCRQRHLLDDLRSDGSSSWGNNRNPKEELLVDVTHKSYRKVDDVKKRLAAQN